MRGLTLHLWRHAKAEKGDAGIADFDRKLTAGGTRAAAEMAMVIIARSDQPTRIVCSTAQRTRETLAPLVLALGAEASIELTRRIYDASPGTLLHLVQAQSSESDSLMLVGHNPGLETLAGLLTGGGEAAALHRFRQGFPPGALAVLQFDADRWPEIAPGNGQLIAFVTPRD
jgi:phosphohistidine phosphatase